MDKVVIRDLRIETVIGVNDWERKVRQTLLLDLDLATEIHAAAAGDELRYALDYDRICARITGLVEGSRCQLLETLAEQIVEVLQQEFDVPWLRLKISKPGAVVNARTVGLVVERGR